MLRTLLEVFVLLVIEAWMVLPSLAQSSEPSSPPPNSNTRSLIVTATSKDSSAVELLPTDLELKENGKAVIIATVAKLQRPPLHYCVLFDISNSETAKFKFQQQEADAVLSHVLSPGTDRGWVSYFSDVARESVETADPPEIESLIPQVSPRGGTALYDAMAGCARRMAKQDDAKQRMLRTIFLFTDGEDDASDMSLEKAANVIVESNVRVVAIVPQSEVKHYPRHALEQFTKRTGGWLFIPKNDEGLKRTVDEVLLDLNSLFEINYVSSPSPGINKIELKARKSRVLIVGPEQVGSAPSQ